MKAGVSPPPQYPCSDARKQSHKRKSNPLKFEEIPGKEPSPAKKLKTDREDSGWGLSSSEDESKPEKTVKSERRETSSKVKAPKLQKESGHSPGAHDKYRTPSDAQDPWDVLQAGEPFRFYLTKVTGVKPKYNTGALHIKGGLQVNAAPQKMYNGLRLLHI